MRAKASTEAQQSAFFRALSQVGVVAEAARVAGLTYGQAYHLKTSDADSALDWEEAMQEFIDTAELELNRRAIEGVPEPVVYKGALCYHHEFLIDEHGVPYIDKDGEPILKSRKVLTIPRKSDMLLKFLLEGRRKEVFAHRTEITGADGAPLQFSDEHAMAARAAQLMAIAKQREADAGEFDDLA